MSHPLHPCPSVSNSPPVRGRRKVMNKSLALLLLVALPAPLAVTAAAPPPPAAKSRARPEAPAPAVSPAVRKLLAAAEKQRSSGHPEAALQTAAQALAAARTARDLPGQARAQMLRGQVYVDLKQLPEAVSAWQNALRAWEQVKDGPGQVEALAWLAVLRRQSRPAEAAARFKQAAEVANAESRRPAATATTLEENARELSRIGLTSEAVLLWKAALRLRERLHRGAAPEALALAATLAELGMAAYDAGDFKAARAYEERALPLQEKHGPQSARHASILNTLGIAAYQQGDLPAAGEVLRWALSIWEKVAPGSADLALTAGNLGNVRREDGDFPAARALYEQALHLYEKLSPGSLEHAGALGNLGLLASAEGNLSRALDLHSQALELDSKRAGAPGTLPAEAARDLNNLGLVYRALGQLARARECFRQALTVADTAAGRRTDHYLNNLGTVALDLEDLDGAQELFRHALDLRRAQADGRPSIDVARSLNNLAIVAIKRGNTAAAESLLEQALKTYQQLAGPGGLSLDVGDAYNNLGLAALDARDYAKARGYFERVLQIQEKVVPESEAVASSLHNLGLAALYLKDLETARRCLERALEIRRKLAPESLSTARLLDHLGVAAWHAGQLEQARDLGRQAWDLLRKQGAAVVGDISRQTFTSGSADVATHLMIYQLQLGQLGRAFQTLEESRAVAFRQQLLERNISPQRVPPALYAEYRAAVDARDAAERAAGTAGLAALQARRQAAAAQESGAKPEELARLKTASETAEARLARARAEFTQQRLRAELRWSDILKEAPELDAAITDIDTAHRALPPGSLYLGFAVGDDVTHTFAIHAPDTPEEALKGPDGKPQLVVAVQNSLTLAELRQLAARFRKAVSRPDTDPAEVRAAGAALYERLFSPNLTRRILAAKRVIIAPDGPLWDIPFAALPLPAEGEAPPAYLGAEHALTLTPSLTAFAQMRARKPTLSPGGIRLLAAGNPVFDRGPGSGPPAGERALLFRGEKAPAPLPGTGVEVAEIARLYGGAALTGDAATEETIRKELPAADVVHLATHGFLHPTRALSSGVLLSVPTRASAPDDTTNDGALQAWEVLSQLKLHAELVILSACETGRGENVQSEGIVGMSRALEFAGARSVVASQWKVADESTRDLMIRFHRGLRSGLPKDEALRQAMDQLRGNSRTAHPYYWAPFLLTGDPENGGLGR